MPDVTLFDHIRTHLAGLGLVRDPRDPAAAVGPRPWLPPIWRNPESMPSPNEPAPGGKPGAMDAADDVVVALLKSPGVPSQPYQSFLRKDGVDIRIRARKWVDAEALGDAIDAALMDKRNWSMAGLTIVESSQFRTWGPLGDPGPQGFDFVAGFLFERYR